MSCDALYHLVVENVTIRWNQAVVDSTGLNPAEVGDVVVGSVLAPGSQRAVECRAALFYAGFPGKRTCSCAL